MRVTSKGQITIPQAVREKAGFLPGTEVDVVIERNSVRIVRARKRKKASRGEEIARRIRGTAKGPWTTDEIMAMFRGE